MPETTIAEPYTSTLECVRDLLEPIRFALLHVLHVQGRIAGEVARGGAGQVAAFLAENAEPHRVPWDEDLVIAAQVARQQAEARLEQSPTELIRWSALREHFDLNRIEELVLLATLAPHFSRGFAQAFAQLCPDSRPGRIPASFVADLLGHGDQLRWEVLAATAPDAKLVREGLMTMTAAGDPGLPHAVGQLGVSPILFDWLMDRDLEPGRCPHLWSVCEIIESDAESGDLPLRPDQAETIDRLSALLDEANRKAQRTLVLSSGGLNPIGIARLLAGRTRARLARITQLSTTASAETLEIVRQIGLVAQLHDLIVLLDLQHVEERSIPALIRTFQATCRAPRRLIVTEQPIAANILQDQDTPCVANLGLLDPEQRLWAWSAHGATNLGLSDDQVDQLARSFALSEAEISSVMSALKTRVSPTDAQEFARLAEDTARGLLSQGMDEVAHKVATHHSFDDLIIIDETRTQLNEVLDYLIQFETVQRRYHIVSASSRGRGTTVLLHGPSGTGKTHAAAILAREAGRDLFRIDISRVMDKYIGETEKQLDKVFALAEASHSVILFDEADSLFAKRASDASSGSERFSNMTVNFLLQRMEAYSGMCVLTTNLLESIDPAFRRRIAFQVAFPKPDEAQRAEIWRYFCSQVDVTGLSDNEYEQLANTCDMTGAHIRNAVVKTTVRSLAEETPISFEMLMHAAESEYGALGGLVRRR